METEKINKYQNGKIYVIRSPSTDKIYIGSTIEKYLSNRLGGHNAHYKRYLTGKHHNITSFKIIKLGDAYIELLELFPCNNKLELCKREGELIRQHKNNCVNRIIEGRSKKEYRQDNKEKIKEQQKQYQQDNKEKIKEKNKQHYENNKEIIKEQKKQYQQDNKEKIKEKYICECGIASTIGHKSRHNKSIKHQDYLKSIQ
jgi:hypothetical protein